MDVKTYPLWRGAAATVSTVLRPGSPDTPDTRNGRNGLDAGGVPPRPHPVVTPATASPKTGQAVRSTVVHRPTGCRTTVTAVADRHRRIAARDTSPAGLSRTPARTPGRACARGLVHDRAPSVDDGPAGTPVRSLRPGPGSPTVGEDTVRFTQDDRLLFIGDSITETGRDFSDGTSLGDGYVRMIAETLGSRAGREAPAVLNRGVSGNRVQDLEARWTRDAVGVRPSVLTVKIGINDTWRFCESGVDSPLDEFEACLDRLLTAAAEELSPRLFVITPFLLPADEGQTGWYEDLSPRIEAVLRVADTHGAVPVRADVLLPRAAEEHGAPALAPDGVHPSPLGHRVIADAWLEAAGNA